MITLIKKVFIISAVLVIGSEFTGDYLGSKYFVLNSAEASGILIVIPPRRPKAPPADCKPKDPRPECAKK